MDVDTDLYYCIAMDPDMAFSINFTMASGGGTGYSQ